MDLTKAIDVMKEKQSLEEEKETKSWKNELPSTLAKTQMSRADRKTLHERRQANLDRQMAIATQMAKKRENVKARDSKYGSLRGEQKREIAWGSKTNQDSWKPTTGTKYVYDDLQKRLKNQELANKEKKWYKQYLDRKKKSLKKLPSYYSPKKYVPEKKEYNPRRKKFEHDTVVFSDTPGPGTYEESLGIGSNIGGGKFSTSAPKSTIEWIQYYAKQIPAPSDYGSPKIPSASSISARFPSTRSKTELEKTILKASRLPGPGQYLGAGHMSLPKGGVMSSSKRKTDVDWAIYRASSIPGPQDYPAPELPRRGGGCISKYKSLTDVEMLVLEAKQKPGPADYADAYNKPNLPKGGRISTDAKSKTWLEWVEYRAKETPGSCDYVAPRLKRRGGGRFSNAKPKTDTEWLIYHKSQLPGPGQYTPKAVFDPSNIKGGRFNESRPKTSIELLQLQAKEMPAPGDYNPRRIEKSGINQKFNLSKPKTDTEWKMYYAAQTPGPGQYKMRPFGESKGGVISASKRKTDVDWAIYRASSIPGPQDYPAPDLGLTRGLFGKISESKPKTHLEWIIYNAKQTPAPGEHRVPRLFDNEKERWNPIKLVGSTLKKDKLTKSAPTLRKIDSVSTSDSFNEKDQKHE